MRFNFPSRVQKEFEARMAKVETTKKHQEEKALMAEEEAMRIIAETQVYISMCCLYRLLCVWFPCHSISTTRFF